MSPKCEGVTNPTNVTDMTPDFTWAFSDPDVGNTQSAYRILVSTSQTTLNANIGEKWNTGYEYSSSSYTVYAGSALNGHSTYYWKVQNWDNYNSTSPFCSAQTFVTMQVASKVICTALPTSINNNGTSTSLITASIYDAGDALVTTATNSVTFSVSGQGTLLGTTIGSAVSGLATIQLQSSTTAGTATVTATSANLTAGSVSVTVMQVASKVICTANPTIINADNTATSLITARILDESNILVSTAGNTILFTITGEGTLQGTTSKSASEGIATALLKSSLTAGTATVTATSSGLSSGTVAVVTIELIASPPVGLRINDYSKHTIEISWQAGEGNIKFDLDKSTDGVNFYLIISSITATSFKDTELKAGTTYWFRIYGYNEYGDKSNPSQISQITESVEIIEPSTEKEIYSEKLEVSVVVSTGTFSMESYVEIEVNPVKEEITIANGRTMAVKNIENTTTNLKAYTLYGAELGEGDFKKEVEIKIHYDKTAVEAASIAEDTLRIYVLDEENSYWNKVTGEQTVDKNNNFVSVKINHFSVYCLMGSGGSLDILNFANYPNPFSGGTVFTFEITKNAAVKLNVYTVSGRLVMKFDAVDVVAGYNVIPNSGIWDGTDSSNPPKQLANGVYMYRIIATTDEGEKCQKTGKLVIIR